jgi:probable rRNA maturation factor
MTATPRIIIDLTIEPGVAPPLDPDEVVAAMTGSLRRLGSAAELSIALVGDATAHELNREHLDHDYPPDVLSFDYADADAEPGPIPRPAIDGEVVVNVDEAVRAAAEHSRPVAEELLRYCIHGALHLAGYDDTTPAARDQMWAVQESLVEAAGLQIGHGGESGPARQ